MKQHPTKKHFIFDVITYSFPLLISRGLGFFLLPVYTRYLSPAEYGVVEMISVLFVLLNITLPMEIKQAVGRYLPEQKDQLSKSKVVSNAYWLTFFVFSVYAIISLVFADFITDVVTGNPEHVLLIQVSGISMLANALFQVVQTQLRFALKAKQAASVSIFFTIVNGVTTVLFLTIFNFGIMSMLIGQLLGSLTGMTIGLIYCSRDIRILFNLDFRKLREMLAFSIPLVFSSVGIYLGMFVDRWMIAEWMTMKEVGIYSVAFKFATVIGLLFLAIGQALVPLVYAHYKNAETPYKIEKILRLLLTLVLPCIICISFFAKPLVQFFTGDDYLESTPLLVWLAITVVFMNLYRFAPGMDIMKRTKRIASVNLITATVNVFLNALLIPKYGTLGAASATLTSGVLMLGLYVFYSQKEYPIPYKWNRIFIASIVTIIAVVTSQLWQIDLLIELITFIILTLVIYKILMEGNEFKTIVF